MKSARSILFCLPLVSASAAVAAETNNVSTAPTGLHVAIRPAGFIEQTASADKIVVRPMAPDLKSVSLVLTGKRAKSVVKAVSLLENDRIDGQDYASCNCENWTLEFYNGTNCLGTATFVDNIVNINDEYRDETGTLRKIDDEISKIVDKKVLELSK
jgi:hypothetical protein